MKRQPGMPVKLGRWFYARGNSGVGRRFLGARRVGFMHAHKGGGPVLIGEATPLTICGFYVNHPWGFFTVQFRRFR